MVKPVSLLIPNVLESGPTARFPEVVKYLIEPSVPVPTPAKISPVGFSSTFIFIVLFFLD